GVIKEQPECVSWGPNRIDCFARGGSNRMYHKWWNGSRWAGWENLGGVIKEQPECVSWGPNRIDCFARGGSNRMYHKWWPCPSCAIQTQRLTVSRYTATTLSNAEVDTILTSSSNVLQTNNGTGDVPCSVRLARSGNISAFTTGDGSLDTAAELSAVFNLAGNVKVVDDVNYCAGQFNTSYIGCGQRPGTSFITERFTSSQEGILWAHEYGHNTGLPHRDTSTKNVMYFSIGSDRQRINQTECDSYRGTSGSTAPSSSGANSKPASVKEFVSQIYFDGLPLDQAATYKDKDTAVLLRMLKDDKQVLYHENIALTLGMIGSSRAVKPLITYINKGSGNEKVMSRQTYKGRVGAIVALGYLVNRTNSEAALSFLISSSSPDVWVKRKIRGLPISDKARQRDLSKYAIISLGLSGNTKAASHLESLRDSAQIRSTNEASFLKDVKGVVNESLKLNKQVLRKGLLKYYERVQK
ncbi:MAG TPA: hypothetical protein ENJ08_06670, partial [Gammaproteobacteria bacterium]|nr:hypothetical protein [Gammaproteobacteria bacterium]